MSTDMLRRLTNRRVIIIIIIIIPQNQKLRLYLIDNQSYGSLNISPLKQCYFFRIFTKIQLNMKFHFCNPQKALPCAEPRRLTY